MEDTCIGCQYLKHPCCTHISSFLRLFGSYSWTIFEASVLHVLQFFLLKAIWLVVQYLHNIWTILEQYLNFIWTIVEQYLNNIASSHFARLTFLPSIWLIVICLALLPTFSLLSPQFTSLIWINHSYLKDFCKKWSTQIWQVPWNWKIRYCFAIFAIFLSICNSGLSYHVTFSYAWNFTVVLLNALQCCKVFVLATVHSSGHKRAYWHNQKTGQ